MPPAGMLVTEPQSGDAPKPSFPMETNTKYKKIGNQPQINHRNFSLFLSLILLLDEGLQPPFRRPGVVALLTPS